jgi:mannose-6-phosphate isomerase class I
VQPAREPIDEAEKGKFFTFFVDDQEFRVSDSTITGAQVMEVAGVPASVGLVLILEDGTQRAVSPEEKLELQPGRRFKKAPRFRRG